MRIDPSFQYLGNTPSEGVGTTQGQSKIPSSPVGPGATPESQTTDPEDTVRLSGTLSDVQQLTTQLAQIPDLRASRVAALQQQVQQGTYQPSNEAIANAMLSELPGFGS